MSIEATIKRTTHNILFRFINITLSTFVRFLSSRKLCKRSLQVYFFLGIIQLMYRTNRRWKTLRDDENLNWSLWSNNEQWCFLGKEEQRVIVNFCWFICACISLRGDLFSHSYFRDLKCCFIYQCFVLSLIITYLNWRLRIIGVSRRSRKKIANYPVYRIFHRLKTV